MKGKSKLHILYQYQLNTYLLVDSVVNNRKKIKKIVNISVCNIQTIAFVQNRVSIFFHEINVELNFDLKFWSGILSQVLKKIWRPNSEICVQEISSYK